MPNDVDKLIEVARKRLTSAQSFEAEQRKERKLDLQYKVGGRHQWDDQAYNDRVSGNPQRPAITINLCRPLSNQVNNSIRKLQPQITVKPRSDGATPETAEVIEGKCRAIQYDSDAEIAYDTAAQYATDSGYGVFGLEAVEREDGNGFEVKLRTIYDPSTVFFDPSAKKPDRSDAKWALVIDRMSRIDYLAGFGESATAEANFYPANTDASVQGWMNPGAKDDSVLVAEYYVIEPWKGDDVAQGRDMAQSSEPIAKAPRRRRNRVIKRIINGMEVLEEAELPGDSIPLFAVHGDETWIDGERHIGSLLRDARGPQTMRNWTATKKAEVLSMTNTNPYLVTPRMIQNVEDRWKKLHLGTYAYITFNPDPQMPEGPKRLDTGEPPVAALTAAEAMATQEIRDVTGVQDPALGKQQYAQQPGYAIQQLRSESDTSVAHYTDNLGRAMRTCGRLMIDWIQTYYDIEEQWQIIDGKMQEKTVWVNKPAVDDKGQAYNHQITQGRYEFVVEMGPGYDTQREESQSLYSGLASGGGDLADVYAYLALKNSDAAGAEEGAELIQRALSMKMPGLFGDADQVNPAVIPQMQAQIQQLQQALQQAGFVIHTKQVEAQGRIQVEKIKQEGALAAAAIKGHTELTRARLEHSHDMYDSTLDASTRAAEHRLNLMHESELAPAPIPPGTPPNGAPQQ